MIRRPDTATLVVIALTVLAFLVLLFIISTAPAKSTTSQAWRPVPAALFSRWPGAPGSGGSIPTVAPSPAGWAVQDTSGWVSGDGGRRVPVSPTAVLPQSSPPPSGRPHPTGVAGVSPLSYGASSGRAIQGIATWFSYVPGQAAAAARLRDLLGPSWRFATVRVCHAGRCLNVVLTDYESSAIPGRLIDLDVSDWAALCGDPARGVCDVTVTR